MTLSHRILALFAFAALLALTACDSRPGDGAGANRRRIVIGLIAKSESNSYFDVARKGAEAAAAELGERHEVIVTIDWQTPPDEDAQRQAEAIDNLATGGAHGIAIACSDGNIVAPAIDRAVERGVPVVCFDSDAPRSKRLTYIGTDETTLGKTLMAELATVMGDTGKIAILAGNQTAPNLKMRRDGVLEELMQHPGMELVDGGIVYNRETPEDAIEAMTTFQSTHPQVQGWAVIGGWPFFTRDALRGMAGNNVKIVSVDALPPMLPYLINGEVQVLLAQDPYGQGFKAVEVLLNRILLNQDPEPRIYGKITKVTSENVEQFVEQWDEQSGN